MNTFKNLPIKSKILFVFLPISIIPLLIFAFFATNLYKTTLEKKTIESVTDNSRLIIKQVEEMMGTVNDCSNMLTIQLNTLINTYENTDRVRTLEYKKAITNELYNANIIFSSVKGIVFLDENGRIYASDVRLLENNAKIYPSSLYQKVKTLTGKSYWFDAEKRDFLTLNADTSVLTLGKKVISIKSGRTLGYLFLILPESSISAIYENQAISYSLLHGAGFEETVAHRIYATDQILIYSNFNLMDWTLVGKGNQNIITPELNKTSIILLVITLFCVLIEIFVTQILSRLITTPIEKMKDHMKLLGEGNFKVSFKTDSTDEIGLFARAFNAMSIKIEKLLLEVEAKEKLKREYELALIQEQVKPHFLYNALDIIYTLSDMGMKKDAQRAIQALADYYRKTLSNGKEIVSISEELDALKGYLFLLKLQYSDAFDYVLDFDDAILDRKIMKLTLQPLVENAIYHGIKPSGRLGLLEISGKFHQGSICLVVKDDGVGMDQKVLNEVMNYDKSSAKDHFGMFTVRDRLQLYFGDRAKLMINSQLDQGTEITIMIPQEVSND